jgi:hypothetical protein
MMNLTSMFITPEQQYQAQNEQNVQQFQRNWMKPQVEAMPDPVLSGINQEIMDIIKAFAGGMGGAMGV